MRYLLPFLLACGSSPIERTTQLNTPMSPQKKSAARSSATIRVHHPEGVTGLRGSPPLSWESTTAIDGEVTVEISDVLEFKPMLGDVWARGPNFKVRAGETVDVYPHFHDTKGRVQLLFSRFHSELLPNDRDVWAYLPPGYDENPDASYDVVYMHDGQNVFDPSTAFGGNEWRADETADLGVQDGWLRELIIIGVGNTGARMTEYTPTNDGAKYVALITDELMPRVAATLRVKQGPEHTAIIGSSLGGLISAYAGIVRPDVFGLIGAMSPSTWYADRWLIGAVAADTDAERPLRVRVDSGDVRDDNVNTRDLAQTYRDIGYVDGESLQYVVQPGASHSEIYWAQRLPDTLQFLFPR